MDILSDASEAWRALAVIQDASDQIIILSPFITGPVLKELVQQSTASKFTIITSLTAKSLHSGSIDLDVLKDLLDLGVDLRTCQPLHAKLMLRGNTMVMGSQNFTSGGMHNLEISIRTELGEQEHRRLNEIVNNALFKSSPIQGALLQSLAEKLSEIELEQVELDDHYQEITRIIEEATNEWTPDLETAQVNAQALFTDDRAAETHAVRLQYGQENSLSWFERVGDKEAYGFGSWFPKSDLSSFIRADGSELNLENGKCHFCLDVETLEAFYLKANKTRSTFIYRYKDGLDWLSDGPDCEIKLTDPSSNGEQANIILTLSDIECDERVGWAYIKRHYLFDGSDLALKSERAYYELEGDCTSKRFCSIEELGKFKPRIPEITNDDLLRSVFENFEAEHQSWERAHDIYEGAYLFELSAAEVFIDTDDEVSSTLPFLCLRQTS